ncbi:triacylglycerol lipase [Oesophagostomum dentatum]|uniref:Triacylglycerol lipase n=1 Tax=Oesophagostomum dentatum TaxID=61180 RepID=A0A0B1S699_OESDE|nr:triacylglycerol lipase [Oesophagostomum dentatum]
MGASLATVTASYIVKWGMWDPKDIRLITLGQPRTGDYEFADWHSATFPYSYRVVHHRDPVPHTPPIEGADSAFHHRFEVWYDNDMAVGQQYTICPEADGDYCSNTVISDEGWDHLLYFNVNVKEWGINGCPSS